MLIGILHTHLFDENPGGFHNSLSPRPELLADMNNDLPVKAVITSKIMALRSFPIRPARHFYDKPLPKYFDPKTVLICCPDPVSQGADSLLPPTLYV
jgi:hypothetical protein